MGRCTEADRLTDVNDEDRVEKRPSAEMNCFPFCPPPKKKEINCFIVAALTPPIPINWD